MLYESRRVNVKALRIDKETRVVILCKYISKKQKEICQVELQIYSTKASKEIEPIRLSPQLFPFDNKQLVSFKDEAVYGSYLKNAKGLIDEEISNKDDGASLYIDPDSDAKYSLKLSSHGQEISFTKRFIPIVKMKDFVEPTGVGFKSWPE